MTMTEACGISIPTSMTVVDTRISVCFCNECGHNLIFFLSFETAVNEPDPVVRKDVLLQVLRHACGVLEIEGFRFRHERIDNEDLVLLGQFLADGLIDLRALGFIEDLRFDGFLLRRKFIDDGNVEIPVNGHGQRSRNRGGRHDQDVRRQTLCPQGCALQDAETVLLVDDDQAETSRS